ncbi:hemolysin family protein [Candidatus Uabimicrobium sp. HlEnr_7]|uniref:hemolysin family protein n=1 Tax=Candidatus Uabimicrobium helgolandensis TaxID=3095367 RepID=UPI00355820D0
MDDPSGSSLFFLITGSLILSIFCKLAKYVYNNFSYAKLDELLKTDDAKNKIQRYITKGSDLLIATSFFGVMSNVVFVVSIIFIFSKNSQVNNTHIVYSVVLSFIPLLFTDIVALYLSDRYSEKIVTWALPVMYVLYWLGIIFVWPLSKFIQFLDTIFTTRSKASSSVFERAILDVVSKGEEEGIFQGSEKNMIEAIIDLREVETKDIMTPRTDMVCASINDSVANVLLLANKEGYSRVPIFKENRDHIVGILYIKDLLDYWSEKDNDKLVIANLMRKAYFIPETKPINKLLKEFQEQKLHIAIVLDEYGGTAGIITVEDILEEIVGEIIDEHDHQTYEEIKFLDDNNVELDARVHVEEINEQFELNIPVDEGYDTIGGFIFSQMGRVPLEGETYEYDDKEFRILQAGERRIDRILMISRSSVKQSS